MGLFVTPIMFGAILALAYKVVMHQTVDMFGIVARFFDISIVGALVDLIAHVAFAGIIC